MVFFGGRWCLLLILISLIECVGGVYVRVIGGRDASLGQFPWQVSVVITQGNLQLLCGGSIVHSKYVITAGHCVRDIYGDGDYPAISIQVLTGVRRSAPLNRAGVRRYFVHPSYSASTSYSNRIDLAILELWDHLTLCTNVNHISVIPLCTSMDNCGTQGSNLIVSGYGQTISDDSRTISDTLKYAPLLAVSQSVCRAKWKSNFGCDCLPETNVCAGGEPDPTGRYRDSCFGDSGGPLINVNVIVNGTSLGPKLWGVVSSGTVPSGNYPSCGKPDEYGVYVSIPPNLYWINSILNITPSLVGYCSAGSGSASYTPYNPPVLPWFAILGIVLGGLMVIFIVIVCCCCW